MAALDTPWLTSMSSYTSRPMEDGSSKSYEDPNPPTVAEFSPVTLSHAPAVMHRSTIIIHKKSPLLLATPPQITRALAYSHPFFLPLNTLVGLLSWSTGDPWQSFLMVCAFWASVLYGDEIIRWAGPLMGVVLLMTGMYLRRFSPLSSTLGLGDSVKRGHKKQSSEIEVRHQKSLDEVVETLSIFTSRCNVLLEPFLRLTDFLSVQQTATHATTRPALRTILLRMVFVTPGWILMSLPPFYILTTKRVILTVGTIALTWHSTPARVSRVILWRSRTIRRVCSIITGLHFTGAEPDSSPATSSKIKKGKSILSSSKSAVDLANQRLKEGKSTPDIRFTFSVYENQRRWLGIGWTPSLLSYERAAWTDDQLNSCPAKEDFKLPEVEGGTAKWRWAKGSDWHVEGGEKDGSDGGWIYYDNKWQDPRRDQDGWSRYTRRRKWCRDAELVDISAPPSPRSSATPLPAELPADGGGDGASDHHNAPADHSEAIKTDDEDNGSIRSRKSTTGKKWFNRKARTSTSTVGSTTGSSIVDQDETSGLRGFPEEVSNRLGIGDDATMGFG